MCMCFVGEVCSLANYVPDGTIIRFGTPVLKFFVKVFLSTVRGSEI